MFGRWTAEGKPFTFPAGFTFAINGDDSCINSQKLSIMLDHFAQFFSLSITVNSPPLPHSSPSTPRLDSVTGHNGITAAWQSEVHPHSRRGIHKPLLVTPFPP